MRSGTRTALPPLNALKTLEAAARHTSFARAAEELHVTPGAVSRQIRALEDVLGFPLFDRTNREVRLTAAAKAYAEVLGDSFRQMERATRRLLEQHRQPSLHVYIAMTFTLRWLVPRLAAFHAKHPRQQIHLSTALPSAEELATSTDVTLRISTEEIIESLAPALVGHRLFDIDLLPVCSPGYLRTGAMGARKDAFPGSTLLHSRARPRDWGAWLAAAGLHDVDAQAGISFESSSLAYQAAIEGVGIAIGMRRLVAADLASGRLVAPHGFAHPTGSGLYLIYAPAAAGKGPVAEFRDWLLEVAGHPG